MANIRTGRKSGFILRSGVMRRESLWLFNTGTSTTVVAGANPVLIGTLNAAAIALEPFTIVRTRGWLHIRSDQISATEDYGVNLGFCVVSTQATGIGVTAVPTPTTDQGSDLWFVYESLSATLRFSTAAAYVTEGIGKDYDSKAMRKVEDEQDIAVVLEAASGLSGVDVYHTGRLLIKLH